jgi:hypothetical protein
VTAAGITLGEIDRLATQYEVPWLDVLMISSNAEGACADLGYPRARMQFQPRGGDEVWQLILPLENPRSRFSLDTEGLWLDGALVADCVGLENDDVVLTYLRAGGRSLTLNTHSRSTCTGCVFCPNVIEDAADATLDAEEELSHLLTWVEADNEWPDLAHVEIITVCSGCFHNSDAAIEHMAALRRAASGHAFRGTLHLLSSVVRDRADLERLAAHAAPFHLTLTVECLSRRELLLKSTKASLTLDDVCQILDDCAELGIAGDFTYVAGLDPFPVALEGLTRLARHVTTFPRIQVYQAHNDYMRRYRDPEAEDVGYFLRLRRAIEGHYAARGVAPRSWENYRPLWYSEFAGAAVTGPRV